MFRRHVVILLLLVIAISGIGQIQNPKVRWKFKTQGTIRGTSHISGDRIFFGSADGHLYAVNKNSGQLIWKYQAQGAISATPLVVEDKVIFTSRDNNVYTLNASNGQLIWKYKMGDLMDGYMEWEYFTASPVVIGNMVLIGSGDGHLYSLSLNQGKLMWKYKTNGRIRATPLVDNGTIYQPSNDGIVYAVDATNGNLIWKFETEGASLDSKKFGFDRTNIFAKPVLKDSILVIASRDGKIYGVNINTRKDQWRFTYGMTWAMATSIENETVYAGWSTNNHVCAIDVAKGTEKWKYVAKGVIYTTPLVLDKEVIVGSADENLYALDKRTGQVRWTYQLGAPIFSSPVASDNIIYVGCDDGYLYAIDEGTKPYKVVYHPYPGKYDFTVDSRITTYLKSKGFEQLDSARLAKFFGDRIRDGAPSVLVMVFDYFPSSMIGEDPSKGLVRQYLESGGKILSFSDIPNLYSIDKEGKPYQDISVADRLLDVKHVRTEDSGNYYSKATQEGLNWGLPSWLTTTFGNISPEGITPLAFDEYGRVSAWVKKFNTRPGSGFVACRTWAWFAPLHDEQLQLIHRLATYQLE